MAAPRNARAMASNPKRVFRARAVRRSLSACPSDILRYTNRYCLAGAKIFVPDHAVSILIPLFNEEEFIGSLLERVLEAPLPDGLGRQIIVVDDGSSDGSDEIVRQIAAQHPGE